MKKRKLSNKFKYKLVSILEDYLWIIGISLIAGGVLLLSKDPKIIIITWVVFLITAAMFKVGLENEN